MGMFMVGDMVRVVTCDCCDGVVGKKGEIRIVDNGKYKISFGKGRPSKGRPEWFTQDMLEAMNTTSVVGE